MLVTLGLVVAAGCSDDPDPPTAADLAASTVGITTEGCGLTPRVASGVVLHDETLVVTAAHPLRGVDGVTVVTGDGARLNATIRAFDKDSDLALLQTGEPAGVPLDTAPVELGEAWLLTWGPDDGVGQIPLEVTRKLSIRIEDIFIEEIVQRSGLEVAGSVERGHSGGAVVTPDGEVVGIIYANSRERDAVGFAVDHTEIAGLFAEGALDGTVTDLGTCS